MERASRFALPIKRSKRPVRVNPALAIARKNKARSQRLFYSAVITLHLAGNEGSPFPNFQA